ncbi:FtsX-like permease family protein [Panacibacter ginsenosidivorans]|uniref:FtsX-like permease family protein n=1 Tax=Panacibacter ginsenosidivorans TaxID=1813871 RepID=A0A5B8V4K9_9BACT|nr:ABC transporter permease [Panacibacter ginsenosidivorans]QEC65965.1 FtsX-like permease family protein [Panacibacter ginsenosidivorans]
MIRNYFKIAWRNLMKQKVFSFINIIGLAVGLTSFLLIALYIFDELTFDSFHANANNIYRVVNDKTSAEGKETKIAGAGYQVSESSKKDFPEIKDAVRITTFGRANVSTIENNNVFYEDFTIGNEAFLTTFDFKLLQGDRTTALTAPHSVILTEDEAKKLFNSVNVLGKAIKADRDTVPYRITGVLQNFPANSSISFNILFSESSIENDEFKKFIKSDWNSDAFSTYLLLNDKANAHDLQTKINNLVVKNSGEQTKAKQNFILQPLKDVHFYSAGIEGNPGNTGNITYVYIFLVVALFVLFIACINYMNLTTARFANRAKEIAVRKVAGASQKNLAAQFLAEAFLLTTIAMLLALISAKILLPAFNDFTQKQLALGVETDYRIWLGMVFIIVFVSLISGIYPAIFQARLKPLLLLKSKINIGKGNISLRRSLVVFQFTLSIVMIVATIVAYMQMQYVNTKDMGFKKDQLVVVDINSGKVRRSAEIIKNEFAKLPQVQDVSVSSRVPGEWKNLPKVEVKKQGEGSTKNNDAFFIGVDEQFLKTYEVALVKGRNFKAGDASDSSSVLINETAAKQLGITEAAGQVIEIPSVNYGGDFSSLDKPFYASVIGIVKDFNFQSLHQSLSPMILAYQNNPIHNIDYFTARVKTGDISATLKQMDVVLHSIDQNHLFEYHFLDKQWDMFYTEDKVRQTIFIGMAILAILIACLGLFGLATYAAEQRIREIGIRKVLGSSVRAIVFMLTKDFLKLIIIAAVIACPVAWFAMNKWLQDFAYRVDIEWWVFIAAALLATFIALATVSFQAIKAAIANPVKSLRTE